VKFYFREGRRVRLQPAHPTMAPIFVEDTSELKFQGLVVGVWRQY
jgi:SOS-response transcriptional repressor LexA